MTPGPYSSDVIRIILLEIGQLPVGVRWAATGVGGYSDIDIVHNVKAAQDEGLLVGMIGSYGKVAIVYRLTGKGREFLEASSHVGVWECAKSLLRSQGHPITIKSMMSALAPNPALMAVTDD